MEYCVGRGADFGPISENFGRTCDQIDRADAMLGGLKERVRSGDVVRSQEAEQETGDPQTVALARRDPQSQTVTLILDDATANVAMYAVAAHASEREAHLREVERYGETLPEGSYGRRNRQAIAAQERRVATRLRAVEQAYRTAVERDAVARVPQPSPGREMELE